MTDYTYVGEELTLFAHATRWKRYWFSQVAPFLRGRVLEVGAGIGANTKLLASRASRIDMVEPDGELARELYRKVGGTPGAGAIFTGDVGALPPDARYDAVVYIDVLEHIEEDARELARAYALLEPGGTLLVLAPACQWLYSAFDRAIGHYRRYNRRSLATLTPPGAELVRLRYLDSCGMALSLANRLLLRQSTPGLRQIAVWDRYFVTVSRALDRVLGYAAGKSIVAAWRRPA